MLWPARNPAGFRRPVKGFSEAARGLAPLDQKMQQRALTRPNQFLAPSELLQALQACRGAFIASAVFSGMSNILMLTGAIFMLEIYDRVLPSRSVPTLIALIVIATVLYVALGILDLIRSRILGRVGASLAEAIC